MKESPLFWPANIKGHTLFVLDETLLPSKLKYIKVRNTRQAVAVIRQMKTRAFGQLLVVLNTFILVIRNSKGPTQKKLLDLVKTTAKALNASRPTFPFGEVTGMVVGWAEQACAQKKDIRLALEKAISGYLKGIRFRRLDRVSRIAKVIKDGDSVLTHCNVSGELAMAAYMCKAQRKRVKFFATETRPYFQGAKLTCWELKRVGADVTLVADNAVGHLMRERFVNRVIVGSDRSCANGDIANKIGTLQIAVLADEFKIPVYVLTQPSKRIKRGRDIPIEIRDESELLMFRGKRIAPQGTQGFYPGFDVVPNKFITKAISIDVH